MGVITATELQLLECFGVECFGVEPKLLDPNDPWSYNDAIYAVQVEGLSISFAVQPSYRDVRLILFRGETRLFELNAMGVADVRVIEETGVDAVEVLMTARSWLRLQLRPVLEIAQGFEEG
jgi:hypothetical protein